MARYVAGAGCARTAAACDSDDFGPPRGEFATLALAMVATGLPVSAWQTDRFCPDEIFTLKAGAGVDWQILAPGAAAEYAALAAARSPTARTWTARPRSRRPAASTPTVTSTATRP